MMAAPFPWTAADMFREHPGEVTLIGEPAIDRDIRQRCLRVQQLLLRALDANAEQPLMWRHSERLPERAREMACRQGAFARNLGERHSPASTNARETHPPAESATSSDGDCR